ncbi:MAG: hypothetical protein ABI551_22295, partial [Polyangiaceae bacterium]
QIMLENEPRPRRLEELTPVVRARESELLPRMSIYAKRGSGWSRTMLVHIDSSGMALVKNPDQVFRDSFFNEKIALDLVRLPLLARDRRRPTRFAMFKESVVSDPVHSLFSIMMKILQFFMIAFVLGPIAYLILVRIFRH